MSIEHTLRPSLEEVSVHGPLGGFYYNPAAEGRCDEGVSWQKLKLTFPIHGMKKNLAARGFCIEGRKARIIVKVHSFRNIVCISAKGLLMLWKVITSTHIVSCRQTCWWGQSGVDISMRENVIIIRWRNVKIFLIRLLSWDYLI